MVLFSMIKDVLHIMFTLVRKRKDSSLWSYKFHCEWFESLRVRTGESGWKYPHSTNAGQGFLTCFWPLMITACMHRLRRTECAIKRARRYQTTVYFTMIKDVLHIMFTLVRKRKDSSFWTYKFHCEWSQSLRVRTGSSRRKSRQHRL